MHDYKVTFHSGFVVWVSHWVCEHFLNVFHELWSESKTSKLFVVVVKQLWRRLAVDVHPPVADEDSLVEQCAVRAEE